MATTKEIIVTIDQDSLNTLMAQGNSLLGFTSLQISTPGAQPLLWYRQRSLMTQNSIMLNGSYGGFVSSSQIMNGATIQISGSIPASLGQTVVINNGGSLQLSSGMSGAITIQNNSSSTYTTGITEAVNGMFQPPGAISLFSRMMTMITPVDRVLLMFSTAPYQTGQVVTQAPANGLLIDLTTVSSRTVSYSVGAGWGNYSGFGAPVSAGASLSSLLIS